ncbi:MAG: hypothetical protein AB7O62_13450 [Pirellulales bacterium]
MNKAFVKEPDPTVGGNCPRCGSAGVAVGATTLDAFLNAEARRNLSEVGWFCPFPRCEAAYFDSFERVAEVDALLRPAYPKTLGAPLCGCFGLTAEEIEQDVHDPVPIRCRELLAKAKSDQARCSVMSPTGQSCVGEVQKYFLKYRQEIQSRQRNE